MAIGVVSLKLIEKTTEINLLAYFMIKKRG